MSVYPTGIDSFTTKVDNVDDVMAADVNSLQSSVVALQNTLGTSDAYNFQANPIALTGINIVASVSGGQAQSMFVHNDKLYIGGGFTSINGVTRSGLAAIDLSDNSLITSFNPSMTPSAFGGPTVGVIRLRDNNSIFVGGSFDYSGVTYSASGIAAVNIADGSLNETFAPALTIGGFGLVYVAAMETGTSDVFIQGSFDSYSNAIKSFDKTTGADAGVSLGESNLLRSNIFNDVFIGFSSNQLKVIDATDGSIIKTLSSTSCNALGSGNSVVFYAGSSIYLDQVSPQPPSRVSVAIYDNINDFENSIKANAYLPLTVSSATPNVTHLAQYKEYVIFDSGFVLTIAKRSDLTTVATAQLPSGQPYVMQVVGDWLYVLFTATAQIGSSTINAVAKIDLSVLP